MTGGYVYRGTPSRRSYGRYVFGDYCSGTDLDGRAEGARVAGRPRSLLHGHDDAASARSARTSAASSTWSTPPAARSTDLRAPEGTRNALTDQGVSVGRVERDAQAALAIGLLERDVGLDLDLVADQPAAGLEGDVPVESPVLAVDLGPGAEAGPARAVHAGVEAEELDIEVDRLR